MMLFHTTRFSRWAVVGVLALPLMMPVDAQAGFQWITPLDQAPAAAAAAPAPQNDVPAAVQLPGAEPVVAPAPVTEPAVTPVVVEPAATPVVVEPAPVLIDAPPAVAPRSDATEVIVPAEMAAPAVADVTVAPVESLSVRPVGEPAPVVVRTYSGQALTDLEPGAPVEGFGNGLPLTVVLKQTMPQGHIFAIEEGINPATPLNWQGGKGWRVVLAEALRGAGLQGHEDGNRLNITWADVVTTPAVAAAPVAVPAEAVAQPVPVDAQASVHVVTPQADAPVAPLTHVEPPVAVETVAAPDAPVVADVTAAPPAAPVVTETGSGDASPVQDTPPLAAAQEPMSVGTEAAPVEAMPQAVESDMGRGKVVMPNAMLEPPLLPGASDTWRAETGEHLRAVIKRWCERANVELVWATEYDYPVQAGVSLSGSFEEAVRDLLSGFVDAKPQPFGRLHDNPGAGQRTLVVQARGNTNGE